MLLTCDKTTLTDALSICIHAAASKSTMPQLEGVLMTARDDNLTICGYNMQIAIEKTIECECDERRDFVMPSHVFLDVLRKLKGDELKLELDDNLNVTISCGRTVVNLKAESSDEFPELPEVIRCRGISMPASLLRQMINDTVYAISVNENKPVHMGSKFDVDLGTLHVISIDGYRLAVRKEQVKVLNNDDIFSFIVPGVTLKELTRLLPDSDDEVCIYPDRKHGIFEFCGTILTTRLLEGDFLDFRTAVPKDMPIKMTIDKSEMTAAVERVSVVITERLKNPVRWLFEWESLKMSCHTALGKAFDEIPVPFTGETLEIGFNSRYILDALRSCPDGDVILELKSGLSPCIFRPVEGDKFLYMVLPVRLKAEGPVNV